MGPGAIGSEVRSACSLPFPRLVGGGSGLGWSYRADRVGLAPARPFPSFAQPGRDDRRWAPSTEGRARGVAGNPKARLWAGAP